MYLVDADVLSEATKTRPHEPVLAWLQAHETDLVTSPIVLGELEYGILKLEAGRKRTALLDWFEQAVTRINQVAFDAGTAGCWARLLAKLRKQGRAMPVKDSLVAASALQHELTVVTRNTKDYQHAGVKLHNPWL